MNNEVIKAMNKKENKDTVFKKIHKWWNKNGYKVMRVVLFPIWLFMLAKEAIEKWLNNRELWNENRVKEIFDYYIPRRAEWDKDTRSFYFFDNGYGWCIKSAKKYIKLKDRRFWKCHSSLIGGKLRRYLIDAYELDGFTKEVGECSDGWTEITFKLKEENKK